MAPSGKTWNITNQHCSITAFTAYKKPYAEIKMQNDFKSKAQTLLISN